MKLRHKPRLKLKNFNSELQVLCFSTSLCDGLGSLMRCRFCWVTKVLIHWSLLWSPAMHSSIISVQFMLDLTHERETSFVRTSKRGNKVWYFLLSQWVITLLQDDGTRDASHKPDVAAILCIYSFSSVMVSERIRATFGHFSVNLVKVCSTFGWKPG